MGELLLCEPSSGFSANVKKVEHRWFLAKLVRDIRRSAKLCLGSIKDLLNMFWEYSPSSANLASDWLRAESSPVDEEEIKIKLDDGVDVSRCGLAVRR